MTPDIYGRIPMVCESGLTMSKVSMARLMMHILQNDIELLEIYTFNNRYPRCQVIASFRIKPEQITEFEEVTKGKLKPPATIQLN